MTDLTPERLAELAELEKVAAPPPWRTTFAHWGRGGISYKDSSSTTSLNGVPSSFITDDSIDLEHMGDARFIVALRNTAPALLAAARELQEVKTENAQHCLDYQAIAEALGILGEWPEMPRVLERIAQVVAAERELHNLKGALEFLDRGDGNRGTHGSDMRAPALLRLARELGWKEIT